MRRARAGARLLAFGISGMSPGGKGMFGVATGTGTNAVALPMIILAFFEIVSLGAGVPVFLIALGLCTAGSRPRLRWRALQTALYSDASGK